MSEWACVCRIKRGNGEKNGEIRGEFHHGSGKGFWGREGKEEKQVCLAK